MVLVLMKTLQVNTVFTLLFAVDLVLNAFAHWFRPFLNNGTLIFFASFCNRLTNSAGWNILDIVVVASSLVSLGTSFLNLNIIRMLRAMRVIRIFGRVNALKKVLLILQNPSFYHVWKFLHMDPK
jgi:hypothetical protein